MLCKWGFIFDPMFITRLIFFHSSLYMSLRMEKPTICIGENKDADQLRLCIRYTDSTISRLSKYKIQPLTIFCDCTARFVSDLVGTQIVGFLTHRLKCNSSNSYRQIQIHVPQSLEPTTMLTY